MSGTDGLDARRTQLEAIDAQIREREQRFEESIAGLRSERELLRAQYAAELRAEVARVDPGADTAPAAPALSRLLAAMEGEHQPMIVRRLREIATKRAGASAV